MIPTADELRLAFRYLDSKNFSRTCRLPLVAARQWRIEWEREAYARFRQGLPNLQEVAWPRLYWQAETVDIRRMFEALTLGLRDQEFSRQSAVESLYRESDQEAVPAWSLVSRFGRYILRSHPKAEGEDFVYLGDDTFFLMQKSRELLESLQKSKIEFVRCLDLCCGGGGVGLALPRFEGELRGIDLNGRATAIAQAAASAQGLENYRYQCIDMKAGLTGQYDLIFGNPPTLSPKLTGRDVFFATGSLETFLQTLELVVAALSPSGRAVFTFFSEVESGRDPAWQNIGELLDSRGGFRCQARREYSLGGDRVLRHSYLELGPPELLEKEFVSGAHPGIRLPGLEWRRR